MIYQRKDEDELGCKQTLENLIARHDLIIMQGLQPFVCKPQGPNTQDQIYPAHVYQKKKKKGHPLQILR